MSLSTMARIGSALAYVALGAILTGIALAVPHWHDVFPWLSKHVHHAVPATAEEHHPNENEDPPFVKLSEAQIAAAGIEISVAQDGTLARRLVVPGTIVPS